MKTFKLILQDSMQVEKIEDVTSFVGEDASGNFGILAGHARLMTSLVFGLARYRTGDQPWQYLAMPGAMLYFVDNKLSISTRRYMKDDDYENISNNLQKQLVAEEANLHEMKQSLHRMEEEILRRMRDAGRKGGLVL